MDSDDLSTDENIKRKREEDKDVDLFAKSKKTVRTPIKSSKSSKESEEKLDKILALLSQQGETIQDLTKEVRQIRMEQKEYCDEIKKLREENASIKEENEAIRQESKEVKREMENIRNRMEWLEKQRKVNNIVMYGLKIDTNDKKEFKKGLENFMKERLDVQARIRDAHKLGERTCLIELEDREGKEDIMANKAKLRDFKGQKVYINNDLTEKEREVQKKIRDRAQKERNEGRQVRVGYNKLVIDGILWRWKKDTGKVERIDAKN